MARESACKLQIGRDRHDGHARLDADHIDFAGATKFRFRISEISNPRREGDVIRFNFHGNPVSMTLGPTGKVSAEWIESITHPRSLADKLGVKSGSLVRVLNLDDAELNTSLASKNVRITHNGDSPYDVVMLGIERPAELRQLTHLAEDLHAEGAIWVVLPKSARTVTKANVLAAAKEAGMSHADVVDFSENRAAYKMVRPALARRK